MCVFLKNTQNRRKSSEISRAGICAIYGVGLDFDFFMFSENTPSLMKFVKNSLGGESLLIKDTYWTCNQFLYEKKSKFPKSEKSARALQIGKNADL